MTYLESMVYAINHLAMDLLPAMTSAAIDGCRRPSYGQFWILNACDSHGFRNHLRILSSWNFTPIDILLSDCNKAPFWREALKGINSVEEVHRQAEQRSLSTGSWYKGHIKEGLYVFALLSFDALPSPRLHHRSLWSGRASITFTRAFFTIILVPQIHT